MHNIVKNAMSSRCSRYFSKLSFEVTCSSKDKSLVVVILFDPLPEKKRIEKVTEKEDTDELEENKELIEIRKKAISLMSEDEDWKAAKKSEINPSNQIDEKFKNFILKIFVLQPRRLFRKLGCLF